MYTIVYFSPTGNTHYLAKELSILLDTKLVLPLEFTEVKSLKKDDHLIIIHAIHGFNAPRTVKRFVKNLPEGLYSSVSILANGCTDIWMNHYVSNDLRVSLNKKGYQVVVDEVLAMPSNFIMAFPDDIAKKNIIYSKIKLTSISKAIKNNTISNRDIAFKSKVINTIGKLESPAARLFGLELHANKSCISCSKCWNNCPENNIKKNQKDKPSFKFNCSMCMRCIYSCPQKAISPYISKFITIKGGYSLDKYL